MQECKPRNAIILAAGFGMRMVPINMEMPKGLLKIKGEPLIERLIKQLHKVGIEDIQIVVGFMKEEYEYLIDEYEVTLVVNPEYRDKNNLHSLNKVIDHIGDTYIVPCDVWCRENPFHKNETCSWYMVSDEPDKHSQVRLNEKGELISTNGKKGGNAMIGISFVSKETGEKLQKNIKKMCLDTRNDHEFWEQGAFEKNKMMLFGKVVSHTDVVEINTYEQLRELDEESVHLKSDAIEIIKEVFQVKDNEIKDITVLKKGMTNRSFLFSCKGKNILCVYQEKVQIC